MHQIRHGVNTPLRPQGCRSYFRVMKTNCRKKHLTFGEFIMAVYDACGRKKAKGIVQLATKARLITLRSQRRFV